ncbi:type IV pilus biogenesis/stability protein PilW [Ectothiorhodospiraceae bacterium WFHF3C12]|nr:type IV pilus biogenesis/stability protein PilW [Ectothiorhodospiraceae bacterium WFHF3C12]
MKRRLVSALVLVFATLVVAGCATTPETGMSEAQRQKAARTNTQLGTQYMQQGDLNRSLEKLNKALRQDPDYAEAHMVKAILHERLEQPDKARDHYEQALDLSPENPTLLNNYGRFLCARDEYEQALEYLERAGSNPLYERPALAWSNAGVCALNKGEDEQAESYLLKALNANARFPSALLRMARLRFDQEQYMSARGFYQRYLSVAEQTPESLWLGVQLEDQLGNQDAVASYSLLLRQKFPDSEETRKLLEWRANEG